MWIKLKHTKYLRVQGQKRAYYAGDWLDISTPVARQWIAEGAAEAPPAYAQELSITGAGAAVRDSDTYQLDQLGLPYSPVLMPSLPYSYTVLLLGARGYRADLLISGLHMLQGRWHLLTPLVDYATLAQDVGSAADRDIAQGIVGDLRVPLYDPRLIIAERNHTTRQLLDVWQQYTDDGMQEQLAFLCAVHQIKPLIYPLPPTWLQSRVQ